MPALVAADERHDHVARRSTPTAPTGQDARDARRRAIGTTTSPATIIVTSPGTRARPASIGVRPSTSCRCCETKYRKPTKRDDAQQVHEDRAGEARGRNSAHVEHRDLDAQLPAHEQGTATRPAAPRAATAADRRPVDRELLDGVDDGHHGRERQQDADRDRSGPGSGRGSRARGAARGPGAAPARARRAGRRSPTQKCSRSIPPTIGPERGAGREAGRPDRDREPALIAVGEDAPQERQGRRHQHRAEDAHAPRGRR